MPRSTCGGADGLELAEVANLMTTQVLHLTPAMLEAAYALLLTTPPYRSWRLPDPSQVEFRAQVCRKEEGWYCRYGRKGSRTERHVICVDVSSVHTLADLIRVMAHEMIHVHEEQRGIRSHHGAAFKRAARRVCTIHGFNRGAFG